MAYELKIGEILLGISMYSERLEKDQNGVFRRSLMIGLGEVESNNPSILDILEPLIHSDATWTIANEGELFPLNTHYRVEQISRQIQAFNGQEVFRVIIIFNYNAQ